MFQITRKIHLMILMTTAVTSTKRARTAIPKKNSASCGILNPADAGKTMMSIGEASKTRAATRRKRAIENSPTTTEPRTLMMTGPKKMMISIRAMSLAV